MIVTIDDAVKAGLCAKGFVRWAKARGMTPRAIRDILANGMQLSALEMIDDPYAKRVCDWVKENKRG